MTTGRARTMAAPLSRPQNQTCDRLAMEATYCWCVPFFRTSLLLAPLDLCTYGYGVPAARATCLSCRGGDLLALWDGPVCTTGSRTAAVLGIKAALAFPPSVTAI